LADRSISAEWVTAGFPVGAHGVATAATPSAALAAVVLRNATRALGFAGARGGIEHGSDLAERVRRPVVGQRERRRGKALRMDAPDSVGMRPQSALLLRRGSRRCVR
jgi:hypothetical protein